MARIAGVALPREMFSGAVTSFSMGVMKPAEPNTTPPKNSASFFVSNIFTPRFCISHLCTRARSGAGSLSLYFSTLSGVFNIF